MDDTESLFGSPPPTPTRGRSPSPALALPSFSGNIINLSNFPAQNVGTIALPGSHNFSELAVNPLALSLSYPPRGEPHRPPAQSRDGFLTQLRPHNLAAASPVVSAAAPLKRKTTVTKKKPPKPKATAPRPTPPPIHLPDPSDPLPPNLLRNQPGLLGTAGVVAGIRPAHLPAPTPPAEPRTPSPSQGTTSADPIFVDEEPQPPRARSSFKRPLHSKLNVDIASLPPPSNRDIIRTLIEQKDIFPLLENILRFMASAESSRSSSSRSQTPESAPSKKKRKLRHVPAGAELWDVPFPFPDGEGPAAYQDDWEKGRGKALIADLVTLIQRAAKKAATTKFLEKERTLTDAQRAAIGKHYRVDTLFYGAETAEVLADASNATRASSDSAPPPPAAPSSSVPWDAPSSPTAFDQLITSLLSAPSTEQLSLDGSSGLDGSVDTSAPLDTGLFNSWMDIFQAFPFPAEGFTPDSFNDNYPIDPNQTFLTIPQSLPTPVPDIPSPALSFDSPADFSQPFAENYHTATMDGLMIDPILLALSRSSSSNLPASIDTSMSNFSDSGCPSLAGSPMPSVSSFSSFGPMTPTETGWNGDVAFGVDGALGMYSPGDGHGFGMQAKASVQPVASTSSCVQPGASTSRVQTPAANISTGTSTGKKRDFNAMVGWTNAEKNALNFLDVFSKSTLRATMGTDKGKGRAEEDSQGMWRRAIWNHMLKKSSR
ncbi:hypothetical protein C8R46DRAFT_1110199 [Mycena filopes]|nr:hypothetical protein C8R46DRAFT_1110199 [Mycena filopes]